MDVEAKHQLTGAPFFKRYGLVAIALGGLSLNHFFAVTESEIYPKLLLISGLLLGFGVAGAVNPEYLRVVRERTQPGDGKRQLVAVVIVLASLLFTFWLWVFYYQAEDAAALRQLIGGG